MGSALVRAVTAAGTSHPGASELVVGVDLGGSKLRVALVRSDGSVVAERTEPTERQDVLTQVVELVCRVDPHRTAAATGVGVPAAVDPRTGAADLAQNVPGLVGVIVVEELRSHLGGPVVVENDAAAAVLGERWLGAARGVDDVLLLTLGTGIGGGIISGGRLLRGRSGAAGELAELPIGGDPTEPRTRRRGTLESVVNSGSLRQRAAALGLEDVPALLAAAQRPGRAREALAEVTQHVAVAVAACVAVLDPELIVLGGGIGAREVVRELVTRQLAAVHERPPRVVTAALGERAGVLGAARLALLSG